MDCVECQSSHCCFESGRMDEYKAGRKKIIQLSEQTAKDIIELIEQKKNSYHGSQNSKSTCNVLITEIKAEFLQDVTKE